MPDDEVMPADTLAEDDDVRSAPVGEVVWADLPADEETLFGVDGHPRRWAILSVLMVSLVIVVLDNTVLNIALPTIQRDLGASQSQLLWSVDSYILAFAALLFTWGTLGDRFGRRLILVLGLAVFAVGSALSALATSPAQLIAFRTIMGVGGAAVMPVTLAIITVVFPRRERGRAIGAWAGAVGGAMALGPVIGGLLLENPQWFRWLIGNDWGSVFLINVPVIVLGIIGVLRVVPETRDPHPRGLDVVGPLFSVCGLTALVYGIVHASDTKGWGDVSVLAPIGAGLVVLALFVLYERRSVHQSFDVTLFAHRGFSVSIASISLTFFALSGVMFTLPFYLQVLRGMSTLSAGLCFLPFAVGQLISAPRSASMVERFGTRKVMTVGMLGMVVILGAFSCLTRSSPLWVLLVEFFLFGLFMGNVMAPGSTVIQNSLPLDRTGAGSAVQNTVRQVFGALGVAIIGTVLSNQYADRLATTLTALPAQFPQAGKDALSSSVAAVPAVLTQASAAGTPAALVARIQDGAFTAYLDATHVTTALSGLIVLGAAAVTFVLLPRHIGRRTRNASHPTSAQH